MTTPRRLIAASIIAANTGYTAFLFPLLGTLYADKVPLTAMNLVAFIVADSIGGALLALLTYAMMRIMRTSIARASALSVSLLWALYWIMTTCTTGSVGDPTIICIDGLAATITWATLVILTKHDSRRP